MLAVEDAVKLFYHRFRMALLGYLILALGMVVALFILHDTTENVEEADDRIAVGVGAMCEAILAPDAEEESVLDELSRGQYTPGSRRDPIRHEVCQRIINRLNAFEGRP